MKTRLLFFVFVLSLASSHALADGTRCAALAGKAFGADIKIDSATLVAATPSVLEHCDVRGVIAPEAKFAVKLPTNWNQRFYMVGGGGFAGQLSLPQMNPGLQQGYATATTDTGHDAAKEPLGTFAERRADNPHADRKKLDYAYLAVHNTAVLAKQIIKAYYGENPKYSYWVGCSTGGRQGLMEAQRYPEDFDGYVIGAPVLKISHEGMRGIWNAQAVSTGAGAIAYDQLPLLAEAVYKKCDDVDGVKDGLIADPRRCQFDPLNDLPKCANEVTGKDCFTTAQRQGLQKVYGGVRNAKGALLYPGQPLGAEIAVNGRSGWMGSIGGDGGMGLGFGETMMRFLAFDPQRGKNWSWKQFNFDTDPPQMKAYSQLIDATNPDLTKLKKRGGKIIHYHGWADALVNPQMSVDYYESVLKKMGTPATKQFYKLYMIPGMFHCAGGVGCDRADWFTPLVAWVEKGVAPNEIAGARIFQNNTVMTRPHCPYPQVAKYKGSGDTSKAENFSCVGASR
ncbi:MAG TPA: tannase/feruloyl esterase family alpha/beta hydrolase [Blastocatellia bacterium]|nr:tannase/feruloyl esterase family alpha/beta hydrolase [Blastocatellia bacterium]